MKSITEMYAYLTVDPSTGQEGIIAMVGPDGRGREVVSPLVGTDYEHMLALKPSVQDRVNKTKQPMRFVRFTEAVDIERINPK